MSERFFQVDVLDAVKEAMEQRPMIVACCILKRVLPNGQAEVLIARRSGGGQFDGYWELPGGKVEAGESPVEALVRELHEELGLTGLHTFYLKQHVQTTQCTDRWATVLCYQAGRDSDSTPAPRRGIHTAVRWVSLEALQLLAKTDKVMPGIIDFVESN